MLHRPVVPVLLALAAALGAWALVMRWPAVWRSAGALLVLPALLWSPPRPAANTKRASCPWSRRAVRRPRVPSDWTVRWPRLLPSLQAVAGAENVVETPLNMGAEDFAYYAKEVPAMFFFVGATAAGKDPATAPSNHSPQFDLDESALDLGLRAMLQVSLDYLDAGEG